MENTTGTIAGAGGCWLQTGTNAKSIVFLNAVINADAVIAAITDNKGNTLAQYNFGSTTLTAGTLITCQGDYFTSITLTSGSVMLYLR